MRRTTAQAIVLLLVGMAAGGCGSLKQARTVTPSGFLGDYSQMHKGQKGQANLFYLNERANFRIYDKILMVPVCIYAGKDSKIAKVPKEDRKRLVDHFDAAIHEKLKPDYTFVELPGPGVMRLRVALTDAKGANVVLDTVSSILPIGVAISALKEVATGTPAAVGSVGVEAEGRDAMTNERLFAGVDAQVGQKYTGKFDKFKKWRTAEAAFNYWAERTAAHLRELREK